MARGIECSHHENVVFLDVLPSIFDQLLGLIRHLPDKWQSWLETRLPELFLPQKLILKREKVDWEDKFDNEKRVYQALAPVQGRVVPRCYGQVNCPRTARTGTRALLLSDIGGMTLDRKATRHIGMERLEDMLWVALRAVAALGVGHDDYKLTNYRLVEDKVMVIDFDSSYLFEVGEDDPESVAESGVEFVARMYHNVHADWTTYYAKLREKGEERRAKIVAGQIQTPEIRTSGMRPGVGPGTPYDVH